MKILVVDDERPLVKGIKFNLENEGYEVDCCYDGAAAVEMARRTAYGLIILDLMMPEKDGLQACQEIRSFSSVPIIMLTARSERSDLLLGFESGADDYVTKPFDILERAAFKDGAEVVLTMKEFDLMLFLMQNPGKVYSREKLLDLVWGYDYLGDSRTVDVHIRRLREKLELHPARPELLLTKWGVGYYLRPAPPSA